MVNQQLSVSDLNSMIEKRADKLLYYFPFSFLRNIDEQKRLNYVIKNFIGQNQTPITAEGNTFIFCYSDFEWESNYFGINSVKLHTILYESTVGIDKAIKQFINLFPAKTYILSDLPSEDNKLFQFLGNRGFKLVETRLNYYLKDLHRFENTRFGVRKATEKDIPNLRRIAMSMRNSYDRFHSDVNFTSERADEYLATYIESSIKGFADVVLVPNEVDLPADSFLTGNYLTNQWEEIGAKASKIVLSAVSNATNKGWFYKLNSELTHHFRDDIGAEAIYVNTQSTNRAAFHTWEKLGYKLGYVTHVFSYFKQ